MNKRDAKAACKTGIVADRFNVSWPPNWTVKELKAACEEDAELPADNMLLFYKGEELLDHQKLSVFKIEDGHELHVQPAREYRASHLGCTPYCRRKHKHVERQPLKDEVEKDEAANQPSHRATSTKNETRNGPIMNNSN